MNYQSPGHKQQDGRGKRQEPRQHTDTRRNETSTEEGTAEENGWTRKVKISVVISVHFLYILFK